MLRKIQRLGASSLIVTLPRNWARRHNLQVGDYVYIYDEGDKLIMSPTSNGREVSVTLDLRHTSNTRHLGKTCICSYVFGFDNVNLAVPRTSKTILEKIDMIKEMLSGEVEVEQNGRSGFQIRYRDHDEVSQDEFFKLFHHYTYEASSFIRRVSTIIQNNAMADDIASMYNRIRRLSYKLLRVANKQVYVDSRQDRLGKILLNIVNLTSLAATTMYTLAMDAAALYDKLTDDEKERLGLLLQILEVTLATIGSAVDPPSIKKAEDLYWKIKTVLDVRTHVRDLIEESSPAFIYILGRIVDIAHIVEYVTASIICYTILSRAALEEAEKSALALK
ncbi:MAG: AbrB/MazE/SpoVT family DNA-binding domain-containing protein [Desulfurococcales archaeon]|nr:AbrB/MazE/SpoVT family DNA-binding domain-containing protein [Desulfurococcales archaeon]